jgi:hypothetical protein
MAYFIVKDGAIGRAFPTRDEADAAAAGDPGARVIGDEWITLSEAKDRVGRASAAIDEVAPMMDPQRVQELHAHLSELDAMLDHALERLGLGPR